MSKVDKLETSRAGTQSIERAITVLRYIAAYDVSGARLADVARDLQLQRSTAHRILGCLVNERLVNIKQPDQRYILGSLTYELGLRAARRNHLNETCRPSLERIALWTGDVVFLSVRSGLETVCVDRAEGDYPIKAYTRQLGDRRPIGFGAVGIAMLAPLPDDEVCRILEAGAETLMAYNGETLEHSWRRIFRARERGFSMNIRKELKLRAIALPINGVSGKPEAAISVCAIAARLDEKRAAEIAKMVTSEIQIIEDQLLHSIQTKNQ